MFYDKLISSTLKLTFDHKHNLVLIENINSIFFWYSFDKSLNYDCLNSVNKISNDLKK